MIGPALRAQLIGTAGIAARIGTRVYPLTMPQNTPFPCITYQTISEVRYLALSGEASPNPYVQIDCWGGSSFTAAGELADLVVAALEGFRGTLGGLVHVSECSQRSRTELFEPETQDYRVSLDFSLWHN